MKVRFGLLLVSVLVTVGACTPPTPGEVTTTTVVLPAPAAATITTTTAIPAATTEPRGQLLLAPGWKVVGRGDRIGGLMFGTGDELIVWGGRPLVPDDNPPPLFDGVAWSHDLLRFRQLPAPPFGSCPGSSGAAWTGDELVVWFRPFANPSCESGGVAAYDPGRDVWRVVNAPEFVEAGASAVWTGSEILAWRQGLALDPLSGAVRHFEPLEINEGIISSGIAAHWIGDELLVMEAATLHRYQPETDSWTRLKSPPIGIVAQSSAWTGTHLLAVNYLMEAALFDPVAENWTPIESMPLRFWESIPITFTSAELTMVRMGSSMAALDGGTWLALPDPVVEWSGEFPYGSMVIADGWIYEVGNFVFRRPVPLVGGEGIQTEPVIPLQTMLLAIPDTWTAQLLPGESGDSNILIDRHGYALQSEDGRSCRIDAFHAGEPPTPLEEVVVINSWDGDEMTIGVDPASNLAVVDDSDRSSDWLTIRCDSAEAAQFMASQVWVAPPETMGNGSG